MINKDELLAELLHLSKDEQIEELQKKCEQYEKSGDYENAVVCCELLVYEFDSFSARFSLPEIYNNAKQYNKTTAFVTDWITNGSGATVFAMEPMPLYYAGVAFGEIGDIQMALTSFNHALDVTKNYIKNYPNASDLDNKKLIAAINLCGIGKLYYNQQDYDNADTYFLDTFDYRPLIDAIYYLSHMYSKGLGSHKDIKWAVERFESIADISLDKSDSSFEYIVKANYELGLIYSSEAGFRNKQKAIQRLTRAKELGYNISDKEIHDITENIIDDKKNEEPKTSTGSSSSGGCYVATCVYGSYDCPPVWTLRRFRDNILSQNIFGRLFVKCYYAISPTIVKLFGNQNWFHKLFKAPLDKLVEKLQSNGVENTAYYD